MALTYPRLRVKWGRVGPKPMAKPPRTIMLQSLMHRAASFALGLSLAASAMAQSPTAFTYQAEIAESGAAASGLYDFQFLLFDAATDGNQLGTTICIDNLTVIDGRFTAELDFGNFFAAPGRHLEISLRPDTGESCSNLSGFITLGPRQKVTAAPLSIFASQAAVATTAQSLNGQPADFYTSASNLGSGTLSDARLSSNVPLRSSTSTQVFSGDISAPRFFGSGASLTNLNASSLASGTINDARLSANIPRLNTSNSFAGGASFIGGVFIDGASGVRIENPDVPFTGLSVGYSGSSPAIIANGFNTNLILGATSAPSAFRLDSFGRIAIQQTLRIGGSDVTNDDLRITGDGTKAELLMESGGTDQIVEIALFENNSNTNGIILREDGRGSVNSLLVIDLSSGVETTLATFDRDDNSFSAPIKAFRIDHPLDPFNKELWHSCVESPEMLNIYSGIATTDATGYVTVALPSYFPALNIEPRYQLTVIDDESVAPASEWTLAKIARPLSPASPAAFTIRTSVPNTRVSWQVTGVRNDPVAQRSRIVPERDKAEELKGTLFSPEAYATTPMK